MEYHAQIQTNNQTTSKERNTITILSLVAPQQHPERITNDLVTPQETKSIKQTQHTNKTPIPPVSYQWILKLKTNKAKQSLPCRKLNARIETSFRKQIPKNLKLVNKSQWSNKNIFSSSPLPTGSKMKLSRQICVLGSHIKLPPTWNPVQSHTCQLFELDKASFEFQNILATMRDTIPNIVIESVRRVQNLMAYQRYYLARKIITRDNVVDANEKLLFHGTRNTNPTSVIGNQDGFDVRLAGNQNLWGPGVYFAEDASYVDPYAFRMSLSSKLIIVASVITGDSFDFGTTAQPSLKKMPINIDTSRRFDSVTGVTKNSRVYSIFDSSQSCPRYLIKYSLKTHDANTSESN
mmetsp:Transcript_96893/g.145146  ORF Transcript_96893/g.145146 Transcript_96893/m.145146 type:complete len:350 (+) Transcript_96893:109-1158(+)